MGKKTGGLIIINTKEKLEVIVRAADDRLAHDIMVLDVAQLTPLAEYFVVMDAKNDRQLSAIVNVITSVIDENNFELKNVEGKNGGKWVLIDMNDIIIHVFHYSERANYNLEKIWQDAPLVDVSDWISEQ
ncbi:ribosome silencing factor [Ruoffia tabacinasalis]|uniref:ribosome silencing factor n=1 Tax=Ruoffia tabacinasalis TaxID=87458 RepID=UPI0022B10F9B|nr:ribosome silencing factor [Ruoffia tabacinasalis]